MEITRPHSEIPKTELERAATWKGQKRGLKKQAL